MSGDQVSGDEMSVHPQLHGLEEGVSAQRTLNRGIKKALLMMESNYNSEAKKSDRSCRNDVDTATGFLEQSNNYKQIAKPHT